MGRQGRNIVGLILALEGTKAEPRDVSTRKGVIKLVRQLRKSGTISSS